METFVTVISSLLILAFITSPIAILIGLRKLHVKRFKFLTYLTLGVLITAAITLIFAWWSVTSNEILLSHYGYDFDSLNETKRFQNISAENLEKVKELEISLLGIGWPLKAIMTFTYYLPYILIVYIIVYLVQVFTKRTTHAQKLS